MIYNRICVQVPTYADNAALPAFTSSNRSTPLSHSSKSALAGLLLWAHAGTDRRTDTAPLRRPCSACYAGSANELRLSLSDLTRPNFLSPVLIRARPESVRMRTATRSALSRSADGISLSLLIHCHDPMSLHIYANVATFRQFNFRFFLRLLPGQLALVLHVSFCA